MKKFILLTLFLTTIANAAPLAGDYFINQDGSEDYISITAAVADLNANGISAPVTFRIRGGTYDEQITINSILRTGASDDRVIFKRAIPAANVTWMNTAAGAGSDWVVQVDGAEFINFANIQFIAFNPNYQGIFNFINSTDSITVANCQLLGTPENNSSLINSTASLSAVSANSTGMIFTGNSFAGASIGIFIDADLSHFTIANNSFTNQYKHAIYAGGSDTTNLIENNLIFDSTIRLLSVAYSAILFNNAGGIVRNNSIYINGNGEKGLKVDGAGAANVLVANNFISSVSTGTSVVGIEVTDSVDIIHNTVYSNQDIDTALKIIGITPNSINIINNILYNSANGLAFSARSSANTAAIDKLIDNNFYNNAVGNPVFPLIIYDEISPGVGKKYDDITTFAYDVRRQHPNVGLSKSITFSNAITGDLHLSGASIGDSYLVAHPQVDVTDDIDGDSRNGLNVYLGADQSTQVAAMDNADALNGLFYAVAGASPDYSTPQEALDDLYRRGMKGEVKFKIRAGSYPTYVQLNNVVKSNATDLITLVGSNPSSPPFLTLAITAENQISFSNLKDAIINTNISSYLYFQNLHFSLTSQGFAVGLKVQNSKQTTIDDCIFTDGDSAIIIYHDELAQDNTSSIVNNKINNQVRKAIEINNSGDIIIDNNTINKFIGDLNIGSIEIYDQSKSTLINANHINGSGSRNSGIRINSSTSSSSSTSLVTNNFINGQLYFSSSSHWEIYHNTINHSNNLNATGFLISNSPSPENFVIKNNIIHADLPISVFESSPLNANDTKVVLDYNIYDDNGSSDLIVFYNQTFTDVPSFTAATGQDFNSQEKAVNFADAAAGDLHLAGASIGDTDLAGVNIAILNDIDGDTRSINFPTIGADEATALSVARVQITADGSQTSEDGLTTVNLSYELLTQPSDDVILNVSSTDTSEGLIDTTVMTFTTSNWNTPQVKTVNGVDDNITDGNVSFAISTTLNSSDVNYDGLATSDVNLNNTDDDQSVKIIVETLSNASEPSTPGSFRFRMEKNIPPPNNIALTNSDDVTIFFSRTGSAINAVDYSDIGSSVVIPALNENVILNIQPIDDNFIEGEEQASVFITNASGGSASYTYDSTLGNLSITDDESGEIFISFQVPAVEPDTNGKIRIELSGGLSEIDTDITVSFAGDASQGVDYQNMPSSVTIPALNSLVEIPITVIDDIDSEDTEEIILSLDATNNPLISIRPTPNPISSSIWDNDTNADIAVSISPLNEAYATGDIIYFAVTLTNNNPINIHQAVIQVPEPQGLSFIDWDCTILCNNGSQSGDINDVISLNANSSIQYQVFALVTGQLSDTLNIEAILNPAPFLNDANTSNNTANASSLIDIYFQNGFESNVSRRLLEQLTEYSTLNKDYKYNYVSKQKGLDTFIEIDKNNLPLRYRYIDIDSIKATLDFSEWIYAKY